MVSRATLSESVGCDVTSQVLSYITTTVQQHFVPVSPFGVRGERVSPISISISTTDQIFNRTARIKASCLPRLRHRAWGILSVLQSTHVDTLSHFSTHQGRRNCTKSPFRPFRRTNEGKNTPFSTSWGVSPLSCLFGATRWISPSFG